MLLFRIPALPHFLHHVLLRNRQDPHVRRPTLSPAPSSPSVAPVAHPRSIHPHRSSFTPWFPLATYAPVSHAPVPGLLLTTQAVETHPSSAISIPVFHQQQPSSSNSSSSRTVTVQAAPPPDGELPPQECSSSSSSNSNSNSNNNNNSRRHPETPTESATGTATVARGSPTIHPTAHEVMNVSAVGTALPSHHVPTASRFLCSIPDPDEAPHRVRVAIPATYNWEQSTSWNYQHRGAPIFTGPFQASRARLDYNYHSAYVPSRQAVQDAILSAMMAHAMNTETGVTSPCGRPWILFTAGAMGVGKNYVVQQLSRCGYFPLSRFAEIDPDAISVQLPELKRYCERNPDTAYTHIHEESAFMAELATLEYLNRSWNILIHGSLRNHSWYLSFLQDVVYGCYPNYRVGILHVVASRALIERRATSRAMQGLCGRRVPASCITDSYEQVPTAVRVLQPHVHFTAVVENGEDALKLITPATWVEFTRAFATSYSTDEQEIPSIGATTSSTDTDTTTVPSP